MKRKKRKLSKCGFWAIVLILCGAYIWPKPLIRNVKDSNIISIMYRADTWENFGYFYPSQAVPTIDEGGLIQILNQSKAAVEVIPYTTIDGIPTGLVTLQISVSDGGRVKTITLGEWNRVTIQGGSTAYQILNADSVLNRVLDFLQIDENTGVSQLQPGG